MTMPYCMGTCLQIDLVRGMMDCLYAECIPCVTDCVMAELEKLGPKYRVALKVAKVSGSIAGRISIKKYRNIILSRIIQRHAAVATLEDLALDGDWLECKSTHVSCALQSPI